MSDSYIMLYVSINYNKHIIEKLLKNVDNKVVVNKLVILYKDYIFISNELKKYIDDNFENNLENVYLRYKTEIELLN